MEIIKEIRYGFILVDVILQKLNWNVIVWGVMAIVMLLLVISYCVLFFKFW